MAQKPQMPLMSQRAFSVAGIRQVKKYTKEHEWIELSSDNKIGLLNFPLGIRPTLTGMAGTIGVSTYAAKSLGDVVYVELPSIDLEVGAGDAIGAVESVKSASDIMTPVSGKITETNGVLEEKPGTINKGPETDGWIAKIEVKDPTEMDGLMSGEDYAKFTEE
ncbi:MAG: glycine cleavage system H-protein subunit [Piccolia ochrophora]|nr:MAG: glycine cleavage system H-protein subunit [Piccolia ochrophora]